MNLENGEFAKQVAIAVTAALALALAQRPAKSPLTLSVSKGLGMSGAEGHVLSGAEGNHTLQSGAERARPSGPTIREGPEGGGAM